MIKRKLYFMLNIFLLLSGSFVSSCASKSATSITTVTAAPKIPPWFTNKLILVKEYPEFDFIGIGVGVSPNMNIARKKANMSALNDIGLDNIKDIMLIKSEIVTENNIYYFYMAVGVKIE